MQLGTHAAQLQNKKIKQPAIAAVLPSMPADVICSSNVHTRKKLWACPDSTDKGSSYPLFLEQSELANADLKSIPTVLPEILKHRLSVRKMAVATTKGLLNISPLPSLSLLNEINIRGGNTEVVERSVVEVRRNLFMRHTELLKDLKGSLRFIRVPERSDKTDNAKHTGIVIRMVVEQMTATEGLASIMSPALATVGVWVNRCVGDVAFAVGINDIEYSPNKIGEAYNRKGKLRPRYGGVSASGEIFLLINTDMSVEDVEKSIKGNTFGGGKVLSRTISYSNDEVAPAADYINPISIDNRPSEESDILDVAIDKIKKHKNHSISLVGFGFLEKPQMRENVIVKGVPHVWSEYLYLMFSLGNFTADSYWRKVEYPNAIMFQGL